MGSRKPYPIEKTFERFMKKVFPEPNTGCWLWSGNHAKKTGHGLVFGPAHKGLNFAHRFSYMIHNGDFDRTLCVLHKCDNASCVNPEHLYVGTQQQNIKDRDNRNRRQKFRGSNNGNSDLTEDQVLEIKKSYRFRSPDNNMYRLAERFNISQSTINNIINGISWKTVKHEPNN